MRFSYCILNRAADLARAFDASVSRSRGFEVMTKPASSAFEFAAISLTVLLKTASLALDGFRNPEILRTYCRAASIIS